MKFKDLELDFDIFNAEDADAYEQALANVKANSKKVDGEPLGDFIRRQCSSVFAFFDELFGENFHQELFGERTNLMECLETYRTFIDTAAKRRADLDALVSGVQEGVAVAAPSRAARRAAAHNP